MVIFASMLEQFMKNHKLNFQALMPEKKVINIFPSVFENCKFIYIAVFRL